LAAVSGIKTATARDDEFLLCNMAPHVRVGDFFACGMFGLVMVSYCQLCRRLRLLAFVNISNDNFMLSIC